MWSILRTSTRNTRRNLFLSSSSSSSSSIFPTPPLKPHHFRRTIYTQPNDNSDQSSSSIPRSEHAVISTFDLFSIGIGPSSSHTIGPMRAAKVFVTSLQDLGLLDKVDKLKIGLYGSLAATGKGHLTPEAIMMGLEGEDPETIQPETVQSRYSSILSTSRISLLSTHTISYSHQRDMLWTMEPLPLHPNGLTFSVYDDKGDLLAMNTYFSVGGGFVVNDRTQVDENLYYRGVRKDMVGVSRRDLDHGLSSTNIDEDGVKKVEALTSGEEEEEERTMKSIVKTSKEEDEKNGLQVESSTKKVKIPPYLFRNAQGLSNMSKQHNLTIAQLVWENERTFQTDEEISTGLLKIWNVMDQSIHSGVTSKEEVLPGRLRVRRRAPGLYKKLFKGFYPTINDTTSSPSESLPSPTTLSLPPSSSPSASSSTSSDEELPLTPRRRTSSSTPRIIIGSPDHPLSPPPPKRPTFPGLDFLSLYAIAVNETNAGGGRIVTAPTNGAAGVIPAVLKYLVEFISDDPARDIQTFLLTSAAIGMLYKRGATISAAEGGCMAEVGVSTSMAAGAFTACMGGSPAQILQAAEIGIEHSLGLTCDPTEGTVQIPCIERNALGAVKAVTAAQIALAGDGFHSVTLDEAIEAMRLTARDMHHHYKETSLSGLATSVKIPVSSPAC